jgi:preprotein translocase subunit YajC
MLIPTAFAESANPLPVATATIPAYGMQQAVIFLIFAAIFYFVFWRPQQQYQKEKNSLINEVRVGDVIYTSGGIIGKITKLADNFCQIEVSENTKIYIQKDTITNVVPKGSLKTLGFD